MLFRGPHYWKLDLSIIDVWWWYDGYEHTPKRFRFYFYVYLMRWYSVRAFPCR